MIITFIPLAPWHSSPLFYKGKKGHTRSERNYEMELPFSIVAFLGCGMKKSWELLNTSTSQLESSETLVPLHIHCFYIIDNYQIFMCWNCLTSVEPPLSLKYVHVFTLLTNKQTHHKTITVIILSHYWFWEMSKEKNSLKLTVLALQCVAIFLFNTWGRTLKSGKQDFKNKEVTFHWVFLFPFTQNMSYTLSCPR